MADNNPQGGQQGDGQGGGQGGQQGGQQGGSSNSTLIDDAGQGGQGGQGGAQGGDDAAAKAAEAAKTAKAERDKTITDKLKAEGKTDEDIKAAIEAADKKAADEAAAAAKKNEVPEKYADFTLPEGVKFVPESLDKFKTLAKELKLSQEGAQKLVNFEIESRKQEAQAQENGHRQMCEGWKAETLKELGADSQKELAFVYKALNKFGTPGLKLLLNDTGIGNHKEMVTFCIRVGKALAEDGLPGGAGGGTAKKTDAELFYGGKK